MFTGQGRALYWTLPSFRKTNYVTKKSISEG